MSTYAIGLLQDESKLATLKQNAFEQAQKFDISNIVPVYEKLYSKFCRMDCKWVFVTAGTIESIVNSILLSNFFYTPKGLIGKVFQLILVLTNL